MTSRIYTVTLSVLIACLLSGCIRTLQPFYKPEQVVFDPALLGVWKPQDANERWMFTKKGEDHYELEYRDKRNEQATFEARLCKVDGRLFLDLYPTEPELTGNDFYKAHLLRAHTFVYVNLTEPTLQISFPNPEWFAKQAKAGTEVPRHTFIGDQPVLTDSTEEIQAFWVQHIQTDGAFSAARTMDRIQHLPLSFPLSEEDRKALQDRLAQLPPGLSDRKVCYNLGVGSWSKEQLGSLTDGTRTVDLGRGYQLRIHYAPKADGGGYISGAIEETAEQSSRHVPK